MSTNTDELKQRIRARLRKLGRPTTEKDLLKGLRVKGDARRDAKQVIETMLSEGKLAKTRAGRVGLPDRMDLVSGWLEVKRSGFGFVVPIEGGGPDIYVAGANLGEALHGDKVLVHIERRGREGRPEGRVVDVLERRTTQIVGRLEIDAGGTRVVPFDSRMLYKVFLPDRDLSGALPGDMVVVELTRFPAPHRSPMGRILEVVGSLETEGVDVKVVIAKHGLPDSFPEKVLAAAEEISTEVSVSAIEGREDFRDHPIVTIDGETARDFDDAVEVEVLDNGNFRLGVHIADVSHYVGRGHALDVEALHRGTSVYFTDRAIPMLPERLSNGICSLNPGVDRLVQSVLVEVTAGGEIVGSRFVDGVMRSAARMTYTKVRQILTDKDETVRGRYKTLVPEFEKMLALFKVLRSRRQARGAIDFERPEAEVILGKDGQVTDIRAAERSVAHRIIEEFMLLANEVVARHLFEAKFPSLYRVHDPPDEDRVGGFEKFILGIGHRLRSPSESLRPKAFQRLLARVEGKPEQRLVSYLMLRAMKQAAYTEESRGHYALAARFYTHFTSPIRRYPDLVVHRLLRELRQSGPPSESEKKSREQALRGIAEHSSFTERRSDEAERELVDWKKVRFMADKVGDVFRGIVTGVTGFGLYVELIEYFVEGLVHISTLANDYYHYNENAHSLRGESTGKIFRLGDTVDVQVVRVNMEARQIELAVEGIEARASRGRPQSKRPRPPRKRKRR